MFTRTELLALLASANKRIPEDQMDKQKLDAVKAQLLGWIRYGLHNRVG